MATGPRVRNVHELHGSAVYGATGQRGRWYVARMVETEEHRIFRRTLRDLFEQEIAPHIDEWERAGTFPAHELFPKLGAVGLLGLEYDEAYGGMAADHSFVVVAGEEMGRVDCGGVPMAIAVQMAMATPALHRYGSDELKARYLAPAIRGEMVASIAVTEADAGSDVAGIRTRAVRHGDEWVINGSKLYITNGTQADWLCLLARTGEGRGTCRSSSSPRPPRASRSRASSRSSACGRATRPSSPSPTCVVPVSNTIGEIGRGFQQQMVQFQAERLITLYRHVGSIAQALDRTRHYLAERRAFGQPLLANQHIQFTLAELSARHDMLRHYAYAAADAVSRGEDSTRFATVGKLLGRTPTARGGRRLPAVPRRHRLHGRPLDVALLPRHPAGLHRRRGRRGDAAHPGPDGRLHGRLTPVAGAAVLARRSPARPVAPAR